MKLLDTAAVLLATAAAVLAQGEDKGELQPMRIEVNVVNATTDINVGELEEATACEMPGCLFIDIELLPDDGYGMLQLLMQVGSSLHSGGFCTEAWRCGLIRRGATDVVLRLHPQHRSEHDRRWRRGVA